MSIPAELLDEMHIGDHILVVLLAPVVLLPQNVARRAGITSKEQQKVLFHIVERPLANLQWPDFHLPTGEEAEASDPAKGRDVLVLFA